MKKIQFLILFLLISVGIKAHNYESEFINYFELKDTLNMLKNLQKWENAKPKDSELYTSYLDYYFLVACYDDLTLETSQPSAESIVLKDSIHKAISQGRNEMTIRKPLILKGISKIEEGILLYPDRLDMRFGEIYVLSVAQEWANLTQKIIEAIDYSAKNKNHWTWTHNLKKEDGEEMFFSLLQDYQILLHNNQDDKLLSFMVDIAKEVLKYYPNHVESLSNLSIVYMTNNEIDKAIDVLLRAENINKKDFVILSNLAYAYKQKGDKVKAIEYYEKTVRYGDKEASRKAREQIRELKK